MGRGLSEHEATRPVLDARDRAAFEAGHAPGAAHLPANEWKARAAELPPRELAFDVVGDDPDHAQLLAAQLATLGFRAALAASTATHARRDETGAARVTLWKPSPWLEASADALPKEGRVLDVATGSGRNAVWLASRGLVVTGVDLLPDALVRAQALARVTPRAGDFASFTVVDATRGLPFRDESFDVVTGFRYLDRALFPRIAQLLRPGGLLLWQTFTEDQRRFGRPRRAEFLLTDARELERLCLGVGLVVEAMDVTPPSAGEALAAVRARRFSLGTVRPGE